jgi:hypothetical protein
MDELWTLGMTSRVDDSWDGWDPYQSREAVPWSRATSRNKVRKVPREYIPTYLPRWVGRAPPVSNPSADVLFLFLV